MTRTHALTARDGLVTLFHADPRLAFDLAAKVGGPVIGPSLKIRSERTDFVDPRDPTLTHRTDIVFVAYATQAGKQVAIAALALDILLDIDPARPPGWSVYPEAIQRRHGCLGQVVIVSPDPRVRDWVREQQQLHDGLHRISLLRP